MKLRNKLLKSGKIEKKYSPFNFQKLKFLFGSSDRKNRIFATSLRGAKRKSEAEIIPIVPAQDNACEGK